MNRILLLFLVVVAGICLSAAVHAAPRSVAYGDDALQTYDLYLPEHVTSLPVIIMVHGGAWRVGDKNSRGVVENKMQHWLPQGFAFASVNYRLKGVTPLEQAQDVARAIASIQKNREIDPSKVILMGHSAGAHLVALLGADPALAKKYGAQPWLGTVALDSAALDVPSIMEKRHMGFYDDAFGADPAFWSAVSPVEKLSASSTPFYLVCSTQRRDRPCLQALAFTVKAKRFGVPVTIDRQDLSHMEINANLGLSSSYTEGVDSFIFSLMPQ